MSSKRAYAGNCRMIEIGVPEIPFRLVLNVDRIDTLRFEELRKEIEVPVPDTGKDAFTDRGGVEHEAVPPEMRRQAIGAGWTIIIVSNGQQNGINFSDIESAMACYNSIMGMIQGVGIPHAFMGLMRLPEPAPEESPIVGIDGEKIKEAVDAVDLHPALAGGEGAGMAENDDEVDENFELSDEDLELLENPVIDENILDDEFAKPDVPPVEN